MSTETVWIPVGELADGFSPESNILPQSYDLAGQTIALDFEDGGARTLRILQQDAVQHIQLEDGSTPEVRITSLREGLYFIDYLPLNEPRGSVTLLLDVASGAALEIDGTMPTSDAAARGPFTRVQAGEPLTAVGAVFRAARVAGGKGEFGFPRTTELVGKRIRYRYSTTELYEHIYLNPSFYSWHCLTGVEAGLCDTDFCHYIKLREELYLFVWQEKIVPTLGVITVDLIRGKTDGKIFGYAGYDFGARSNFPVGAYVEFVNFTATPVTG